MPRVTDSHYVNPETGRRVRKPSGMNYFDTKSGRWYQTEWQYRNRRARSQGYKGESDRATRRSRLRARGYTPKQRTRRRTAYQRGPEYTTLITDDFFRLEAMITANARRTGFVQVFVPGDTLPGGRTKYTGPKPKDLKGEEIPGQWLTLGPFHRMGDYIEDIYQIFDDIGGDRFGAVWKIGIQV